MNKHMFGRIHRAIVAAFVFSLAATIGAEGSAATSVLLAFSSDRCSHCQAMKPTIDLLANSGTPVRHVNVNAEPELARRHGILQTPTYVILSAGRELTRLVGTQSVEKLRQALATNPAGLPIPTGATGHPQTVLNAPETRLASLAATPPPAAARSEAMPNRSVADAVQRARAATVRLRVYEGRGFGVGTGTIIDRHGEEALVLTCGHLFRETKLQAKIEVDLFIGGQIKTVPGKVIDYDAEDRDIGLVVIQPGFEIQPVGIANPAVAPQTGQSVFSFGCDHGDDPSRRDTRITGVDKYNQHVNASNIEIAGAPVDGRSGGGLFDQAGRLIGVCNAADYKGDIGIYTGPGSIQWQLDRLKLAHLYQQDPGLSAAPAMTNTPSINQPQTSLASFNQGPSTNPSVDPSPASRVTPGEMLIIIRDPNSPDGQRRINVQHPSRELMEMIHRHVN